MATHYTGALLICLFCFLNRLSGRFRRLLCPGLLGRKSDGHTLSFQQRHLLNLRIVFQIIGKTQQKHFTLFLEQNRTALEEHVCLYLVAVLKEANRMFQLEVVVVFVRLRTDGKEKCDGSKIL